MYRTTAQLPGGAARGFLLCIMAVLFAPGLATAQVIPLTLDQAFEVAARNYPLLKRDRQFIEQQNILIRSAGARP
ncbi:MAG: hypothetical protein KDD09_26200, partial [Phaeodactylibacter sp.]|nr:hypothetical protein [Phaeodactylibacter sp.]